MLHAKQAVPGIIEAIERLRALGIQIIAAENNGPALATATVLSHAGIPVDHVVTRREVGVNKGSPYWITHICQITGLATNQLLYVGDSRQDMITASHSNVVYIHAAWTGTPSPYGFQAPTPGWVAAVVTHIFRKRHPWGWTLNHPATGGRTIRQLALVDVNAVKQAAIQNDLLAMFKERREPQVGLMPLREFVTLHLTASIYADSLQDQTDTWGTMPSHDGRRVNRMGPRLDIVAKLFRDNYNGELFIRHRVAQHSSDARSQGGISGAITNQIETLHLNPAVTQRIAGRTILLIDDFLTKGVSTGVGRLLLRLGGAHDVLVVASVKYGSSSIVLTRPDDAQRWDPTLAAPVGSAASIRYREVDGTFREAAQNEFIASYRAMQGEQW
jgi:hypothetical protein